MFEHVDETLRHLLMDEVPIRNGDVDIAFQRPNREWSGRLSKPALNLFLFDISENRSLRDDRLRVRPGGNGKAESQIPARRIDLAYLVTAWAKEPEDEHRILGRVLAAMYRSGEVSPVHLQGDLQAADYAVYTRIGQADELAPRHDLWGVLDNDLRASLCWIVTAPLDAFHAFSGPIVATAEVAVAIRDAPGSGDLIRHVGGQVRRKGEQPGMPGVSLQLVGTAFEAETDSEGRFRFTNVPEGEYEVRVERKGSKPGKAHITVPAQTYDVEIS